MRGVDVFGRKLTFDGNTENLNVSSLTVIFIHGSGGDREDWKSQLDDMDDAVQLVALDLPGHGASSPPGESAVPAYEQWVDGFVQALGLEKVVLVGCSGERCSPVGCAGIEALARWYWAGRLRRTPQSSSSNIGGLSERSGAGLECDHRLRPVPVRQ